MSRAMLGLLGVLLLGAGAAQAQGIELQAINLAGEQRMLSQRIVKSWVQVGLGVQPALSRRQLDESVARFERNLRQLEPMMASPEARGALGGVRFAGTSLLAAVRGASRQADAALVDARAEDVLMAAERLTRLLQDQSSVGTGRWVNLAGRQRMLSQRLVKIYMLRQWGMDNARLRDELESIQNEFSGALAAMQQRGANTEALREELDKLALQWEWLRTALATEGAESFRLILAESGEAVLALAEEVTRLYEKSPP